MSIHSSCHCMAVCIRVPRGELQMHISFILRVTAWLSAYEFPGESSRCTSHWRQMRRTWSLPPEATEAPSGLQSTVNTSSA